MLPAITMTCSKIDWCNNGDTGPHPQRSSYLQLILLVMGKLAFFSGYILSLGISAAFQDRLQGRPGAVCQHKRDSVVFLWTLYFICFLFLVFYIALIFCLFLFSSLWVFLKGKVSFFVSYFYGLLFCFVFWKWEKEHKVGQVGRWGGSGNCINSFNTIKNRKLFFATTKLCVGPWCA